MNKKFDAFLIVKQAGENVTIAKTQSKKEEEEEEEEVFESTFEDLKFFIQM